MWLISVSYMTVLATQKDACLYRHRTMKAHGIFSVLKPHEINGSPSYHPRRTFVLETDDDIIGTVPSFFSLQPLVHVQGEGPRETRASNTRIWNRFCDDPNKSVSSDSFRPHLGELGSTRGRARATKAGRWHLPWGGTAIPLKESERG